MGEKVECYCTYGEREREWNPREKRERSGYYINRRLLKNDNSVARCATRKVVWFAGGIGKKEDEERVEYAHCAPVHKLLQCGT